MYKSNQKEKINTTTLKAHITELLTSIEDERFLQSITAMLQSYITDSPSLSQEEKVAIDAGVQDMKTGKLVKHQEVKQNTQAS